MRKNNIVTIAALCCATLGGCATLGIGAPSNTQKIETVCATVAQGVRVLADPAIAPKLDQPTLAAIGAALAITTPICTAPTPPSLATAKMLELTNAADAITTLSTQYGPTHGPTP